MSVICDLYICMFATILWYFKSVIPVTIIPVKVVPVTFMYVKDIPVTVIPLTVIPGIVKPINSNSYNIHTCKS